MTLSLPLCKDHRLRGSLSCVVTCCTCLASILSSISCLLFLIQRLIYNQSPALSQCLLTTVVGFLLVLSPSIEYNASASAFAPHGLCCVHFHVLSDILLLPRYLTLNSDIISLSLTLMGCRWFGLISPVLPCMKFFAREPLSSTHFALFWSGYLRIPLKKHRVVF